MTKSRGPRTDPCGTPAGRGRMSEEVSSTLVNCKRSVRYELSQRKAESKNFEIMMQARAKYLMINRVESGRQI